MHVCRVDIMVSGERHQLSMRMVRVEDESRDVVVQTCSTLDETFGRIWEYSTRVQAACIPAKSIRKRKDTPFELLARSQWRKLCERSQQMQSVVAPS